MPLSADRVEKFTPTLRDQGIEFVDTIEELLPKVDEVLLHSVDGGAEVMLEEVRKPPASAYLESIRIKKSDAKAPPEESQR